MRSDDEKASTERANKKMAVVLPFRRSTDLTVRVQPLGRANVLLLMLLADQLLP